MKNWAEGKKEKGKPPLKEKITNGSGIGPGRFYKTGHMARKINMKTIAQFSFLLVMAVTVLSACGGGGSAAAPATAPLASASFFTISN